MYRREFLQALSATPLLLPVGLQASPADEEDAEVKDQLLRSRRPDQHYCNDIMIEAEQKPLLYSVQQRLGRLQKTVGHGNFALLGVDEMRAYGRNYSVIGRFTKAEEALLEQLFYADASSYGFYGEKPLGKLTDRIERRVLKRQSGSSQYLFKGEAQAAYEKIREAVGSELVLTSGVRGVVKQMHLFLTKAVAFDGNLSLASRSLAPPGYSFHGIGDFDVGQRGWGGRNFSPAFAESDVFKRLQDLGYISMRYPHDNPLGVRYEPWHIKVMRS
jgi:hypothetical protein